MSKSRFESYPNDVLKLLVELLNSNMSESKYGHDTINVLYPQRDPSIINILKISASQFGESNLTVEDLEFLLNLWGMNPNFEEGDEVKLPKLSFFAVNTRVNLKQYVREEWITRYDTYLTEKQLQSYLEEYENNYWEGENQYSEITHSDTMDSDIDDIYEIESNNLTESKKLTIKESTEVKKLLNIRNSIDKRLKQLGIK